MTISPSDHTEVSLRGLNSPESSTTEGEGRRGHRAPARLFHRRLSLAAAIDRLPLREQQTLILLYMLDLTYLDVAAVLGVSRARIWQHERSALRRLRRSVA